MAIQNPKQVKLQPKYRELSQGSKIVPWLSVSGVWLEELGFKAGDRVRILTREKLLIIELVEEQPFLEQEQNKKDLATIKLQLKKLIQ